MLKVGDEVRFTSDSGAQEFKLKWRFKDLLVVKTIFGDRAEFEGTMFCAHISHLELARVPW